MLRQEMRLGHRLKYRSFRAVNASQRWVQRAVQRGPIVKSDCHWFSTVAPCGRMWPMHPDRPLCPSAEPP